MKSSISKLSSPCLASGFCTILLLGTLAGNCRADGPVSRVANAAQATETVVYTFSTPQNAENSPGCVPEGSLLQASDGNLYGTAAHCGPSGYGTVFKLSLHGAQKAVSVLHSFDAAADGSDPMTGMIQASDGNFYGATASDGAYGVGTLFRLTPQGSFTVLYAFTGGDDGAYPNGPPVQGPDGNLYGTTAVSGSAGAGTVFKISLTGELTTLYAFSGADDGGIPQTGLTLGSDGQFYGSTLIGSLYGSGNIFRIGADGAFTEIHAMQVSDGEQIGAALTQAPDGYFYGTAEVSGDATAGTVFKVNAAGDFAVLHAFTGGADGSWPQCKLLLGRDGRLYGTAWEGGKAGDSPANTGNGDVFALTTEGSFNKLYAFGGHNDGRLPLGGLIQLRDGLLYGATSAGGSADAGTVYSIDLSH